MFEIQREKTSVWQKSSFHSDWPRGPLQTADGPTRAGLLSQQTPLPKAAECTFPAEHEGPHSILLSQVLTVAFQKAGYDSDLVLRNFNNDFRSRVDWLSNAHQHAFIHVDVKKIFSYYRCVLWFCTQAQWWLGRTYSKLTSPAEVGPTECCSTVMWKWPGDQRLEVLFSGPWIMDIRSKWYVQNSEKLEVKKIVFKLCLTLCFCDAFSLNTFLYNAPPPQYWGSSPGPHCVLDQCSSTELCPTPRNPSQY